jgi:RNA polymerase sigma-70 factor (ECF subfamily)
VKTTDKVFNEEISRLWPKAYSMVASIVGDNDADDVVSMAFQKAHRKLSGFNGKSKLSTWLFTIVRNEALMFKRASKTRDKYFCEMPLGLVDDIGTNSLGPRKIMRIAECHMLVKRLPDTLEEKDKEIFRGVFEESTAISVYSRKKKVKEAMVKSRVYRFRRSLKKDHPQASEFLNRG